MSEYAISVDIYCESAYDREPSYRIYLDTDLLTERTWLWPRHEIYISEQIVADLEPGSHYVKIEVLNGFDGIRARNLTVNGQVQQDLGFVTE